MSQTIDISDERSPAGRQRRRLWTSSLLLALFILAVSLANVIWIRINTAPPRMWDDTEYLAESVEVYRAFERGDAREFLRLSTRPARGGHPPMMTLLPVPLHVLLGPSMNAALYAYTILIPVFCVYLFLLARSLYGNDRLALVAVCVTCLFPLAYGLWRNSMAEFGTGVAAIAAQYHLFRCIRPERRRLLHGILAGAFIGWGLLWKISFPIFVAGPLLWLAFNALPAWWRRGDRSGVSILAWIAAGALVVAGPFYALRFRPVVAFFLWNSLPNPGLQSFGLGPVYSPRTVLRYWILLVNLGTSAYLFLVLVALAIWRLLQRGPRQRGGGWYLALCGVPSLIVFSFHQLKEPRHLFPAFAILGIVFAVLIERTIGRLAMPFRTLTLLTLLAFPAFQFAYMSFEIGWRPRQDIRIGPLVLLYSDREALSMTPIPSYAFPANPTRWPVRELVEVVWRNSDPIAGRSPRVRVAGLIPYFDATVLNLGSVLYQGRTLTYNLPHDDTLSRNWDFVVVLSGPIGGISELRETQLAELLEQGRLPYTHVADVPLPGGRSALVYRAASAPPRLLPVVHLTPDSAPIYRYLYVPDSTELSMRLSRNAGPSCGARSAVLSLTVNDPGINYLPGRTVTRTVALSPEADRQAVRFDLNDFRDRTVNIKLEIVPADEGHCFRWTDVTLDSTASHR